MYNRKRVRSQAKTYPEKAVSLYPMCSPTKSHCLATRASIPPVVLPIHLSTSSASTTLTHHEKLSSLRSTFHRLCLPLTARLTSSAKLPVPQTLTTAAPTPPSNSCSTSCPTFGRPGNICTLALGLLISFVLLGRVTNSRILRTSRRWGRLRMEVIQGRIHSRCSGDWITQIRVKRRQATVPAAKPVTRRRTCGTWCVMPTPAAKRRTVP